jgi:hypothetical protein
VYRFALVFLALLLLAFSTSRQQPKPDSAAAQKTPSYSTIPVEAAKAPNPIKSTPQSQARARKWWTIDCEMCPTRTVTAKAKRPRI